MCGLLCTLVLLCLLCMVVGVCGFVYCSCSVHGPTRESLVQTTTSTTIETPSYLKINYTATNCSSPFRLGRVILAHVCWHANRVILDIRDFSPNKATAKGIALTKIEWKSLKQLRHVVDKEISDKEFNHTIFNYKDWHL